MSRVALSDFQDFVVGEEKRRESWWMSFAAEKMIANTRPNTGSSGHCQALRVGRIKRCDHAIC
jgi:hypothetical protein